MKKHLPWRMIPIWLSAGVWTTDLNRAMKMSQGIKAGTVWINTYNKNFPEAEFGGYKQSGQGINPVELTGRLGNIVKQNIFILKLINKEESKGGFTVAFGQLVQALDFEFSFNLPTLIEFGYGKAAELGQRLKQLEVKQVFLVTDKGVESAGLLAPLADSLKNSGIFFDNYTGVEPDPSLETIRLGVEAFRQKPYDCIVAVGGGSPIDTAKGIRVVAANGGNIDHYAGVNRIPVAPTIPLLAIPTTSGTGSEVTMFGVYSDWQNNVKVTVTSRHMAPTIALVDPALTMSLPAKMTAASGIDALAHGIETFFSSSVPHPMP